MMFVPVTRRWPSGGRWTGIPRPRCHTGGIKRTCSIARPGQRFTPLLPVRRANHGQSTACQQVPGLRTLFMENKSWSASSSSEVSPRSAKKRSAANLAFRVLGDVDFMLQSSSSSVRILAVQGGLVWFSFKACWQGAFLSGQPEYGFKVSRR